MPSTRQLGPRRERNNSSPLLALPGELRDHIYRHVTSEHFVRLTTRRRGVHSDSVGRKPPREYRARKSLGLTQVCKQLREEFLPLHLASLRCGLYSRESTAYLNTFYPSWAPLGKSIPVDLEDLVYRTHDFLPILRLHSVGVAVHWHRLNRDKVWIDLEMSTILRTGGNNKAWCRFLSSKCSKFEYRIGSSISLKIVVKSSAKEAWMPWDAKTNVDNVSAETRQAMAKWKIFNGISHLRRMPHVLAEEQE